MARFQSASEEYLKQIDSEIERLRALREQVAGTIQSEARLTKRATREVSKPAKKKRGISDAGRKAIAEAQRKRWAVKKAAAKKTVKKAVRKPARAASEKKATRKRATQPAASQEAAE